MEEVKNLRTPIDSFDVDFYTTELDGNHLFFLCLNHLFFNSGVANKVEVTEKYLKAFPQERSKIINRLIKRTMVDFLNMVEYSEPQTFKDDDRVVTVLGWNKQKHLWWKRDVNNNIIEETITI